MAKQLYTCEFEIFGRVQGVFFRKHTEKQANVLQLRGWCMNTSQGTVKGIMQGSQTKIQEMKKWLSTKGSPKSRIDNSVFSDVKEIEEYGFPNFCIKT